MDIHWKTLAFPRTKNCKCSEIDSIVSLTWCYDCWRTWSIDILYIKKNVCLFVRMKLIKIHISEPIWTKLCTRLPLSLEETVGYVWTQNSRPLWPSGPFFLWGTLQNHGHNMAAGANVFRNTLISVIPADVHVTSPTWRCRRRRSHPRQPYIGDSSGSFSNVAEMTVIRHSVVSLIPAGVCVTLRILRSTGRQDYPPQRYIPHSSSCFCDLQKITSLQTTVARSYSKCVALSLMRRISWDVNGIHVSTI
jgi:hypothetical protein